MTTNITTDPSGTITTIDLGYRGCPEHVGAFLVRTSDGPVLVECGPAHCLPALTHGLEQAGTALEDIRHLFLTHIHLDHAGATGACTKAGAQAHVHPRGARHLVDPSQLMGSARRVFGAFLDTYLGCLEASDDSMVDPVEDQQVIDVGTARFTAIETPGHARHHHAWLAEIDGTRHLFSGDVAGMRLPGTDFVTLPLVAPELDTATWLDSIERLRGLEADRLWLTHFGLVENIGAFLDSAAERLTAEADFVRTLIESSTDTDLPERIATYRAWHTALALEQDVDRALLDAHCPDLHFEANLVGVGRWIDKHGSRSA